MPHPKPPYPAPFRKQMVALVRAGRKPSELAEEFGCHPSSILNWVCLADRTHGVAPSPSGAPSAAEGQILQLSTIGR